MPKTRTPRLYIPPELAAIALTVRRAARLQRAAYQYETTLGKALVPVLHRLTKKGDKGRLLAVADCIKEAGSFNARFFYEAAYRIKS